MDIKKILKEELSKISLESKEEENLKKVAEKIISDLRAAGLKAEVGGSLAKGTLIRKKTQDVDIFVIFNNEDEIGKLADFLDKTEWDIQRIHGSRDYFHIILNDLIVELIPVLTFDEPAEAKNVTDFSLLHVSYVGKKVKKNKNLPGEIKLAKTFCHAQGCYGAESYIKGFSGYALELLVLHYGSFEKMLKGIVKAKIPLVVDSEKQFKTDPMKELNESKLQSPIILVDPTYKYRNATAGLSQETFNKFVSAAKLFLQKPSLNFFNETKIDLDKMKNNAKKSKGKFIEIEFKTDRQEGDIAATKMKKLFDFMISELERKSQKVLAREFEYLDGQKAKGYLVVKENREIEMHGPPVEMKEAVKAFKKVNKKIYSRKGFVFAKKKISLAEIFAHISDFQKEMGSQFKVK